MINCAIAYMTLTAAGKIISREERMSSVRHRVYAYYCEDRLFLAECECCEKTVLVKASNPNEAASKAFWGMEADYGE